MQTEKTNNIFRFNKILVLAFFCSDDLSLYTRRAQDNQIEATLSILEPPAEKGLDGICSPTMATSRPVIPPGNHVHWPCRRMICVYLNTTASIDRDKWRRVHPSSSSSSQHRDRFPEAATAAFGTARQELQACRHVTCRHIEFPGGDDRPGITFVRDNGLRCNSVARTTR